MRIDSTTRFWVTTEPTAVSVIGDILFQTDLAGLALQVKGGLDLAADVALYDNEEEAREDARRRLLVRHVADDLRAARGLPVDEVVRVVMHGADGRTLWTREVR